jgi:hypothetical protein
MLNHIFAEILILMLKKTEVQKNGATTFRMTAFNIKALSKMTLRVTTFIIMTQNGLYVTLSATVYSVMQCHYAWCRYAECHNYHVINRALAPTKWQYQLQV